MPRNTKLRSLLSAVLTAVAGLHAVPHAQASQAIDLPPDTGSSPSASDIWQTIDRINGNNPTLYMKVKVAQEAGRSATIAAIVQAIRSATTPEQAAAAVEAAIERLGGLTVRNIISLADLTAALRALGLDETMIVAALNAYSSQVADAVANGVIPATTAAAVLSEGATGGNLYG